MAPKLKRRSGSTGFDYLQSRRDSPCRIKAAAARWSRAPLLSLSKWDGNGALLFKSEFPGEKVWKTEHELGRTVLTTDKRCHIYRRLDGGNVEYDILLPEIPDSPMIKIPLEQSRGLSFHKQGKRWGHLMSDKVRGSYAVYGESKGGGYRNGKLCHIYRPRIIDAANRQIWGELDYDGEALCITIDEEWLKTARYPVTVDPRIGSDSVGAGNYDFFNSEPGMPTVDLGMALQKLTPDLPVAGACTPYYYSYKNEWEAGGFPVIYDGNLPANLVSSNAPFINLYVPTGDPASWKSGSFDVVNQQAAGDTIWFGLMAKYYYCPYFDEVDGAQLRVHYPSSFDTPPAVCGSTYSYPDILLSMYFDYISVTTWNVEITGRIKPDGELSHSAEYLRQPSDDEGLTEGISASRGLIRLIEGMASYTEALDLTAHFRRAAEDLMDLTEVFTRHLSSFITIIESWAVWDLIRPNPSHISEVLILYSRISRSIDIKSPI